MVRAATLLIIFITPYVCQADITIDDFTNRGIITDQAAVRVGVLLPISNLGVTLNANLAPGQLGVLGGQRDLHLTTNGLLQTITMDIDNEFAPLFNGVPDQLRASVTVGALANSQFGITWDGAGGLGGVDITQGGNNDRFRITFTESDYSTARYGMTLVDQIGRTVSADNIPLGFVFSAQDEDILFSDFVGDVGFDFTDIDSIRLDLETNTLLSVLGDIQISNISAVPEPSSIFLLGLGSVVLLRRLRKRSSLEAKDVT